MDESWTGKRVVGEGVESRKAIKWVFGGDPDLEGESEDRKASDGGVGVNNVEGGMGEVRRAEIVMKLMASRRRLKTRSDEAKLAEGQVAVASVRGETAGKESGGEATSDRVSS